MNIYNQVEKFVLDSFVKAGKEGQNTHFLRTVFWLKELNHEADEAMLTAAIAHDIERAFRTEETYAKFKDSPWTDPEFLAMHQNGGAEIMENFLKSIADKEFIEKVKILITRHELGGTDEQNLLKDADSLSFFENNTTAFVKDKRKSTEKIKEKIDWMYNRITSEKAKEICREWYQNALKLLENN